jgi:hypothetical protein
MKLLQTKNCIYCGIEYIPRYMRQKICGKIKCKKQYMFNSNKKKNDKRKATNPFIKCRNCGIKFKIGRGYIFCSEECCKEYRGIYRTINKNKINKKMLKYYHNNIEECKERSRRNSKKNTIKKREYAVNYNKTHKEANYAVIKRWRNSPKGKFLKMLSDCEYRNRRKGIKHIFTYSEWSNKVKTTHGFCPICFNKFGKYRRRMTMDHEPAISTVKRGHKYYIDDVTPMCQSCNSSKHIKSIKINFIVVIKKLMIHLEKNGVFIQ